MFPRLLCFLLLPAAVSFAAEAPLQHSLTLDRAIVRVLERSPAIEAADYESGAAAARIRSAKRSPAFRATLELENFAGSGAASGSDILESTLSLSKVLELGDKAALRGELATDKAMLLRNRQDAERLDLLAQTTRNFIAVVAAQERLEIAIDSLALAEKTAEVVIRRVEAGKSPNAELRRVRMERARKALQLNDAERKLAISSLKLAALWGDTRADFAAAAANLFDIEPAASFETLARLLEKNPELVSLLTEQRLSATRLQLARSNRSTNIEVAGGVRHFNASDDFALVLSFDIPLGSASRASADIEEAGLSAQRNPLLYKQRRLALYSTLFEVHQQIGFALEKLTALRGTIVPQAELALQDYETGYAAGRYSFLELTEAQHALLDARLDAVDTAADYHRYRIEIDRLTGAGLLGGDNP